MLIYTYSVNYGSSNWKNNYADNSNNYSIILNHYFIVGKYTTILLGFFLRLLLLICSSEVLVKSLTVFIAHITKIVKKKSRCEWRK